MKVVTLIRQYESFTTKEGKVDNYMFRTIQILLNDIGDMDNTFSKA